MNSWANVGGGYLNTASAKYVSFIWLLLCVCSSWWLRCAASERQWDGLHLWLHRVHRANCWVYCNDITCLSSTIHVTSLVCTYAEDASSFTYLTDYRVWDCFFFAYVAWFVYTCVEDVSQFMCRTDYHVCDCFFVECCVAINRAATVSGGQANTASKMCVFFMCDWMC